MTIKTARGRGWMTTNGLRDSWEEDDTRNVPVVIVHGLSESEVHEAANLLAKSREVCEWERRERNGGAVDLYTPKLHVASAAIYVFTKPEFCPSCGRRVVVKEG